MSKKDNESRSTKWGSRVNPKFPMLYETHRPMFFDGSLRQTPDERWEEAFGVSNGSRPLGHTHDGQCVKCGGMCHFAEDADPR